MACNCIETLREETGDPNGLLKPWGSHLAFVYRPIDARGHRFHKHKVLPLKPKFCPLCGKPYKEKKDAQPIT